MGTLSTLEKLLLLIMMLLLDMVRQVQPQEFCKDPADIAILLDSSRLVRSNTWVKLKKFAESFTSQLEINDNHHRLALITYGSQAHEHFDLQNSKSKDEVLKGLQEASFTNERGNLTAGLEKVESMFVASKGDRPMAPNAAVIFIASIPEVGRDGVIKMAERLHQKNIRVFVVGYGSEVDGVELRVIATNPDEQHLYHATNYNQLNSTLRDQLLKDLCRDVELCTEAADLVFILDTSGSIEKYWRTALNFAKGIIDTLPVGPSNVRIAVVVYSNEAHMEFGFDTYMTRQSLKDALDKVTYHDENTNTSGAIRFTRTYVFGPRFGDRPSVRDVAILITDGESTWDKHLVKREADLAHRQGIQIYAIGLGDEVNFEELKVIASDPDVSHVTQVDNAHDLVDSTIVLKWSQCEADHSVCPSVVDLVIILDSSGSIGPENFQRMLNFVQKLISKLNIDGGSARVAVGTFGNETKMEITLGQYRLSEDVANAINDIKYMYGMTNTSGALRAVRENVFISTSEQPEVMKICLVITDGGSDNPDDTYHEAAKLRDDDVTILSLGVGDETWLQISELRAIASEPRNKNVLKVGGFGQLDSVTEALQKMMCNEVNECESSPCLNRGRCEDKINSYFCHCLDGYAGNNCQHECSATYDIVLAVDGSGSVGEDNYYAVLEFLRDLVDSMPFPQTKVGVLTFADNVTIRFNLNKYSTKRKILDALYFRYTGGRTKTAEALRAARQMFTSVNGDRSSVNNLLILLTDGRSNDPTATWWESVETRKAGIHIVAIGVGKEALVTELQGIATGPEDSNLYLVQNFNDIKDIKTGLLTALCNGQQTCSDTPCFNNAQCEPSINMYTCVCSDGFAGEHCQIASSRLLDVVFILDLSGSLHHEDMPHPVVLIKKVIRQMNISPDGTRVALITFSDKPRIEFTFDNYTNKYDIIHALDLVQYMGGGTKMAPALKLARSLVTSQGRSQLTGVHHYFIIITEDIPDDFEAALKVATECKNDGTELLVVGMGINDKQRILFYSLASWPPEVTVGVVDKVLDVETYADSLINLAIAELDVCSSHPCTNGGECLVTMTNAYTCVCPYPHTGHQCQRTCKKQMDVAIVLDTSMEDDLYDLARSLILQLMDGLQFNYGATRIAFVTFNKTATLQFDFNAYKERREFINAMSFTRQGHGTDIAQAFKLMTTSVFVQNGGDRNNVMNVALVISDGFADDISSISRPAGDITVFTIGLSHDINPSVLEAAASDPPSTHTYLAATKNEAIDAAEKLLNQLCL